MRTVPLVPPPPASTGSLGAGAVLRRLMRDYVSRQWHLFAGGILALLLAAAAGGVLPQLVKLELKQVFDKGSPSWLLPLSLVAFATIALRAIGMFAGRALIDTLGEKAVAAAQHDMFRSLIRSDLASLNALHSGQFISSFLYDATLLRDAFTLAVAAIFLEAVSLVCYLGYAFWVDWQLCLLALVATPAVAWAMERLGGSIRRAAMRGMQETGNLSVALAEAMDGRRIVKAYGLEDHVTGRVDASLSVRLRTLVKAVQLRAAAAPATEIFMGVVIALVLYVAGWQHLQGGLSADTFGGFLTALLLAQQPVRNLSQLWPSAMPGVAAANRIFASIDARPSILDTPNARTLKVARAPQGGAVRFSNVSFSYHGAADTAVSGIDLDILPGSKVALVGPSGAGKSTIFNLLLRFYDIEGGGISIDGADIRSVTLASLRANIGMVTQEPILFDESIADNIALGKPGASRAEIEAAARDAAAHDFIMELPQGYDTSVGEGGLKLSGGQRQRIAIARAMLKNAPILLLDEATSALDTTSERQVQEALNRLMHDRTTIVIAHRLSTVLDAARIYVLDKGGVAEAGTHAELMVQGGLYAGLYRHGLDGGGLMRTAGLRAWEILGHVLQPLAPLWLRHRVARGKEEPARLSERMGAATAGRPEGRLVWVHGASVGESLAALPLIEKLMADGFHVLVTSGTVTSAAMMAKRLPAQIGSTVAIHQYVPLDLPRAVARFLDHWRPEAGLFVESDLWPNLIGAAQARGIRLALINARMSEKSAQGWRRAPKTAAALLAAFDLCLAQDDEIAARFRSLGARGVSVVGSLKADAPPLAADEAALAAMRAQIGTRPVLLAAQTHAGEDETILPAHDALRQAFPDLLTIIVPRHTGRGEHIAMLCGPRPSARRSLQQPVTPLTAVYIADTMGELGLFYRLTPFCFLGGSLVPMGGHNPQEPAALGCAVLAGPHRSNSVAAHDAIFAAQGFGPVASSTDIAREAGRLIAHPDAALQAGNAARQGAATLQGAVVKSAGLLEELLSHARA